MYEKTNIMLFRPLNFIYSLRKSNLAKDLSWTLIANLSSNLLRFLLIFVIVRCYSKEEFGLWASITSIAAVIVTGDFGLTNVLRNIASEGLVNHVDGEKRTKEYLFSAMFFLLGFAIIVISILYLYRESELFELLFKTDNVQLKTIGKGLVIIILSIFLLNLPFSVIGGLFLSYGEIKEKSIFEIANGLLTFSVVIALSIKHVRIDVVTISYFLCSFVVSLFSSLFFLRRRRWCVPNMKTKDIIRNVLHMLPTGSAFICTGFSSRFISNVLTIYSGAMLGLSAAATINVAQKIYTFFISIIQSLLNPIWARLSQMYFEGNFMQCRKILYNSLIGTVVFSLLIIIVSTIFRDFLIHVVAGSDYSVELLLFILVGGCLFSKVIFDNSSLLLYATNKLRIILIGYLIFCGLVFYLFPIIVNSMGFLWMMICLIICWLTFSLITLINTHSILTQKDKYK